jgi:hypothetical protein
MAVPYPNVKVGTVSVTRTVRSGSLKREQVTEYEVWVHERPIAPNAWLRSKVGRRYMITRDLGNRLALYARPKFWTHADFLRVRDEIERMLQEHWKVEKGTDADD